MALELQVIGPGSGKPGDEEEKADDAAEQLIKRTRSVSEVLFSPVHLNLANRCDDIEQVLHATYTRRTRDPYFYFWKVHLRSLRTFAESDTFKFVKQKNYPEVEPFAAALAEVYELWTLASRVVKASDRGMYDQKLLSAEARLAAAFSMLLDLTRKDVRNPWDLTPYALLRRSSSQKQYSRIQDILFWPRFIGEMQDKVQMSILAEALMHHIQVVENQKIVIDKESFIKMVSSCFGANPNDIVARSKGRVSWTSFIRRFGPTLDTLLQRMIGVVDPESYELSPWMDYGLDTIEKAKKWWKSARGPGAVEFVVGVSRSLESFIIHYTWYKDDEDQELGQGKLRHAKVYLSPSGYTLRGDTRPNSKVTYHFTLRDLCAAYYYETASNMLDTEKFDWSLKSNRTVLRKLHSQRSYASLEDDSQSPKLPSLSRFLNIQDLTEDVEVDFGALFQEHERQLKIVFEYLKERALGALRSDMLMIGVFMILQPILPYYRQAGKSPEAELINMIPIHFQTLEFEGFRTTLASIAARLCISTFTDKSLAKADKQFRRHQDQFRVRVRRSLTRLAAKVDAATRPRAWYQTLGKIVKVSLFFPFSFIIYLFWPSDGFTTSWQHRLLPYKGNRYSYGCRIFWSLLSLLLLIACYYTPLINIVLYHIDLQVVVSSNVSLFEAYQPFCLLFVFALVIGWASSNKVSETRGVKERFTMARLMVMGCECGELEPDRTTHGPTDFTDETHNPFFGLDWFHSHGMQDPDSDDDLSFLRTLWSYSRKGRLTLVIAVCLAVGNAVLPTLYREYTQRYLSNKSRLDQVVATLHIAATLFGTSSVAFLLQAASLHYLGVRDWMDHTIALTSSKKATLKKFPYYLPIYKPVNFTYWSLLRRAGKNLVDPFISVIVAVALMMDLFLVVTILIRSFLIKNVPFEFDLFNLLAIYNLFFLTTYLFQIVGVVVSLNEKVHREAVECLQQCKIDLANYKAIIHKQLFYVRVQSEEKEVNRYDVDGLEEKNQDSLRATRLQDELRDVYCCKGMVDASLTAMGTGVDSPITILGLVVDSNFLATVIAGAATAIVSVSVSLINKYIK